MSSIRAPANQGVSDSPMLQAVWDQMLEDRSPWKSAADKVDLAFKVFNYRLTYKAPPDIDVFDVEKNKADKTVVYDPIGYDTLRCTREGFRHVLRMKMTSFLQRMTANQQYALEAKVQYLRGDTVLSTHVYRAT